MSPIWMIPVLVAPIGALFVAALARQTAAATRELVDEVDRLGEIAVAGAIVWDGLQETGQALRERRRR